MFIFTDIETTGLSERRNVMLSLGLIVTDNLFNPIAEREWVIHRWPTNMAIVEMADFVRDMHTKSGLLARVFAADPTAGCHLAVEMEACAWLDALVGARAEKITDRPIMAGNSIAFDREFIREQMPDLHERYSYRLLDVSSLKVLATATVPGAQEWNDSRPDPAHTPLADLRASLSELAHWREVLRRPLEPRVVVRRSAATFSFDANGSPLE